MRKLFLDDDQDAPRKRPFEQNDPENLDPVRRKLDFDDVGDLPKTSSASPFLALLESTPAIPKLQHTSDKQEAR